MAVLKKVKEMQKLKMSIFDVAIARKNYTNSVKVVTVCVLRCSVFFTHSLDKMRWLNGAKYNTNLK